jgi:hypothetical protein
MKTVFMTSGLLMLLARLSKTTAAPVDIPVSLKDMVLAELRQISQTTESAATMLQVGEPNVVADVSISSVLRVLTLADKCVARDCQNRPHPIPLQERGHCYERQRCSLL